MTDNYVDPNAIAVAKYYVRPAAHTRLPRNPG